MLAILGASLLILVIFSPLIFTAINLAKINKLIEKNPMVERLPWLLYLVACFWVVISCFLLPSVGAGFSDQEFSIFTIIRIFGAFLTPLLIATGFLIEAFKPTWRSKRVPWWIFLFIVVVVVGYSLLTYRLDHDLIAGNDLDTMLILAGAIFLPALASLIPISKAPDKENRWIYGLISFGFWSLGLTALLPLWLVEESFASLAFLFSLMLFVLTLLATLIKLKQLKGEELPIKL